MKFNLLKLKLLGLALLACVSVFAQESIQPFSRLGIGLKASTLGYGIEAATPLSNFFILRLGVNLTAGFKSGYVSVPIPDDRDEDGIYVSDRFGYVPDYRAKAGVNFTHGNLLLDFHPAGIIHLTAGAFIGTSKFVVNGYLADYNNGNRPARLLPGYDWPTIDASGHELYFKNGRAKIDMQLGTNLIKPYCGLGIGRAVAKNKRVAFKFEMGLLWQSGYSLKNNGEVFDISNSYQEELHDIHHTLTQYMKAWPMLNLQLSYRIF